MSYGVLPDGSVKNEDLATSVRTVVENASQVETASADPTVDDDTDAGYSPGHVWVNTNSEAVFVCVSAASGAAVWSSITGGGASLWSGEVKGGGTATATGTPGAALGRSGSPSTFTLAIPAAQLEAGAVFRIYAIAAGVNGDEMKLNGPDIQVADAGTSGLYTLETLLMIGTEGAEGKASFISAYNVAQSDANQAAETVDTTSDYTMFLSGEGFMGNNMTGVLLRAERLT